MALGFIFKGPEGFVHFLRKTRLLSMFQVCSCQPLRLACPPLEERQFLNVCLPCPLSKILHGEVLPQSLHLEGVALGVISASVVRIG